MKNYNPVINLNTLQVFNNISIASTYTGCDRTSISNCCNNKLNSCLDKYKTKVKWQFAYDFVLEYGVDYFMDNCYFGTKPNYVDMMGGISKHEKF